MFKQMHTHTQVRGLGTLYTSHYKIGYSIPAIVKKMDVLSGTYYPL